MPLNARPPQPAESIGTLIKREFADPQCWIYPAILPRSGKLLFGGQAKIGKSMVMLELARSLAAASTPFNYPGFSVPDSARVLIMEQELGAFGLQKRAQRVFFGLPTELLSQNLWYVSKEPELKLDSPHGLRLIRDLLDQVQPNVLILDPISKFHTSDENSNTDIARVLTQIDRLISDYRELGLAIIISHHFGKPSRDPRFSFDPLDPYNFRGSSNWYGDMDTLVTVHRLAQIPSVDYEAWRFRSRWISRHGDAPTKELLMSVNRHDDLRVRYEREGELPLRV